MKGCRTCKTYKDCAGKEWYSYAEIRFCPFQILWAIEFLEPEQWPPSPAESNYYDLGIRKGYASEASFTKPAGILGEVCYRLERCGVSGKLLMAQVLAELEISPEANDALYYCKGWRRKTMSFAKWKKQRKYRGSFDYQRVVKIFESYSDFKKRRRHRVK